MYIYTYICSFWPEFQVGSDFSFLRWGRKRYSKPTHTRPAKFRVVTTTTSTARRAQRQRAQDRALAIFAKANQRLSAHHGSAEMTWETKGKGKGYYQYIPGWAGDTSSWGWGETKGKGKGKPSNARKGKGMDKDLTTIEACHAAILEGKAENKKLQAEAAKAINQSKQLLANLNKKNTKDNANDSAATGSAAGEGELLCPKCGAAHHNLSKIRCRMTNCRAVLQPKGEEIGNQTAEAKLKKPKDPVQSNFMQALLARHNAKELLLEPDSKSGAQSPMDAGATSDASQDVEMAEPTLDHDTQRSKLEGILKTLKDAGAPAATIRAQEQAIAALPKPKPEKPLMDAAHFSRALSQAQEYHQSVAALDAKKVEACQAAIVKAQANMQTALQEQQEHAQYAELAVTKLRSLITKTQSEVTQVIPAAKPQESPDFRMLMAEFLNSIDTNLKAAPHLKAFIENVDFVPRASATTAAPIASGADGPREPAQGKAAAEAAEKTPVDGK